MKKKDLATLRAKLTSELKKEVQTLKGEVIREQLEFKVNPPKDSNSIAKKKRRIAQFLTIIGEKERDEKLISNSTKS